MSTIFYVENCLQEVQLSPSCATLVHHHLIFPVMTKKSCMFHADPESSAPWKNVSTQNQSDFNHLPGDHLPASTMLDEGARQVMVTAQSLLKFCAPSTIHR